jgi:NADH-quinone oxidoreductase subunit E
MEAGTAVMCNDNIDKIIDKYRGKPGSLIHVLMAIQHENHWLPRDVLHRVAEALEVPFGRVLQITTLYKTFSLTPKGRHEVHVCTGISCHLRGAAQLLDTVQRVTGIKPGETDAASRFSLETGSCLGTCSLGPEIIVDGTHHARMTPAKVDDVLKHYR